MGDVELRGFGWRLLFVVERWKKKTEPTSPPSTTQHHAGSFEANGSTLYDDKTVSLGFGRTSS